MTRKKLNLSYIDNDSMRKATFNKRKKGFMKKIHELTVLCGIEACAVVYNPSNSTPEAWPSNSGVKNVVEKFEMLTEVEQEKRMVNHEGFLKQNISKAVANNNKKMKDNGERLMKEVMFQLLRGKRDEFKLTNKNREDLCNYIDQYLRELHHHKNETLKRSSEATNAMAPPSMVEVSSHSFPYLNVGNSPRPANDLWSLKPIISSSEIPEEVNTLTGAAADQQEYYPVGLSDQYQYQQQYEYPIEPQDLIDNPSQNQDQQEEWLISNDGPF
ncbi:agamous-like MADS-box protein AGL80 [Capsella rubella]|uniref:agamous-like MADS-box protein AGL80 n=1 Tax=Capsella rubella TaxID=81985 RepID=UPI000CD510BC|nr:agamous-like MADS-box protein AGL80 [Capsella rubella]